MAIRISPYSDGQGQLALPTRRMQGMSSAQMNSASAVGRSLQNFGQGMQNFGQSLAKVEIKRMQDEARVDVLNKTAQMQEEYLQFDDNERRNPSGRGHTSATQNWFDTRVADDDMAPVNHFAEQMWAEQQISLRSQFTNNAIKFEAQQRLAQVGTQIDASLDRLEMAVYTNPELFENTMNNWNTYTSPEGGVQVGAIDGPDIIAGERGDTPVGYLSPTALANINDAGKARLAGAYLNGLVRDDPLRALQLIDQGGLDDGNFYGMELNTLMSIRGRAFSAASVVNEAALTSLENNFAAHLASVGAGGNGLPMFSQPETIEATVMAAFGGDDVLSYFPQNRARAENIISGLRSDLRVATTTGSILNTLRFADPAASATFIRFADQVAMASTVTAADIDSSSLFGPTVENPAQAIAALRQLPADEAFKVINNVSAQLVNNAQLRATDPVGWITTNPATELLHSDISSQGRALIAQGRAPTDANDFKIYATSVDAAYEASGQPAGSRPLLSTAGASSMVNSILSERNPGVLVATITNMQETYGEYFPRVWQQLSTADDGLGAQYMFLATIGNSRGMELYANALINNQQSLESFFTGANSGMSYSQALDSSKASWNSSGLMNTLTGGMPERIPEANAIAEVVHRTVPIIMATEGLNNSEAYNTAYNRLFGEQSRISQISSDRVNAMVTTDLEDERGNRMFPANVEIGGDMFFSSRRIMEGTIMSVLSESQYRGGTLVVPGSMDPIMNASAGLRTTQLLELIMNEGQITANDDSTGFFVTVPTGSLGREPLKVNVPQADGSVQVRPLSIPLWYFNRPDWQWEQTHYSEFPIPENENPE
jgi:hypothetical protein